MEKVNARSQLSKVDAQNSSVVTSTGSGTVDVYFVGKPFGALDHAARKTGLLELVEHDAARARTLVKRATTRVAKGVTMEQARLWVNKVQSAGWQVALVRDGRVCYRSPLASNQTGNAPLQKAGKAATPVSLPHASLPSKVRLKRVADTDGIGSFCIPVQWQALPQLNTNACLAFGDCDSDLYWIAIRQSKQSVGSLIPLRHYAEAVCEAAKHWVNKGRILGELQPMEGKPAFLARLTGRVGDKEVSYQIGIHETKKHYYCTYGWTTADQFSRYRLLFRAMACSFDAAK